MYNVHRVPHADLLAICWRVLSNITTFSLEQNIYFPFCIILIATVITLVKRKISDLATAVDLRHCKCDSNDHKQRILVYTRFQKRALVKGVSSIFK